MSKGTVIDINANKPHISGLAVCLQCGAEWVAVAPAGVNWMECTKCGTFKGTFKGAMQRDTEPSWECNCGNSLFEICPDGIFCPKCGILQNFGSFYD